jgi:hypothetical protein
MANTTKKTKTTIEKCQQNVQNQGRVEPSTGGFKLDEAKIRAKGKV